MVAEYNII